MSIMEKFAALPPEQREKFAAVKDATALDAFLSENKLTLTDEDVGKVTGGQEEEYQTNLPELKCPKCGSKDLEWVGSTQLKCKTCKLLFYPSMVK